MKEITRLLEEIDDATGVIHSIHLCSDWSGTVELSVAEKVIFAFNTKKEAKKRLRKYLEKLNK